MKLEPAATLTTLATRLMATTRSDTGSFGGVATVVTTVAVTATALAAFGGPVAAVGGAGASTLGSGHQMFLISRDVRFEVLTVKTSLAGAVGDGGHATVVLVAAAVEYHGVDAGVLGAFRDKARPPSWPSRSCHR